MTLSAHAFGYVRDLVKREAAIVLAPGKEYLVESRLSALARAHGGDVSAYVSAVQSSGTPAQRLAIVEALTTNETSWFRDGEPFDVFRTHVLPELLQRSTGRINVWSAACSSGQEAYTVAMLMADHAAGKPVEILASDLSSEMVERTRAGRYSQLEIGRGLAAPLMVKHFHRTGTHWQVSERLRSMVRAQRINLAAPFPPLPVFDVVFLRNVLIYFDTATKRAILQRVRQVLHPEGFLFLGGAESTLGIDESWTRTTVGRFTLYRPHQPPAAPSRPTATPGTAGGPRAVPDLRPLAHPTTAGRSSPTTTAARFGWTAAAEGR